MHVNALSRRVQLSTQKAWELFVCRAPQLTLLTRLPSWSRRGAPRQGRDTYERREREGRMEEEGEESGRDGGEVPYRHFFFPLPALTPTHHIFVTKGKIRQKCVALHSIDTNMTRWLNIPQATNTVMYVLAYTNEAANINHTTTASWNKTFLAFCCTAWFTVSEVYRDMSVWLQMTAIWSGAMRSVTNNHSNASNDLCTITSTRFT